MANWNEQTEQPVYIHTYQLSSESCRRVLVSGCYRHTFLRGYIARRYVPTHVHGVALVLTSCFISVSGRERKKERERQKEIAKRNTGEKILAIVSKLVCP